MADADRKKWDDRYQSETVADRAPTPFLVAQAARLPEQGRALDVAGGTGRHAVWLARRGLDVTLVDISSVALVRAGQRADQAGVTLRTVAADLEHEPLPAGPWEVIVCVDFLWRPLFDGFPRALAPGGLLIVSHPTRTNLERHSSPGARFLLDDGELRRLVAGLDVVAFDEGWDDDDRHTARLVARL